MDFSAATFWWVAAGVAVAVELATGTFYLLMIALGLAGAAVVAMFGLGVTAQIVAAALIGGGATALWHRRRFNQPQLGTGAREPRRQPRHRRARERARLEHRRHDPGPVPRLHLDRAPRPRRRARARANTS